MPPVTEIVFVPGPIEPATKRGWSGLTREARRSGVDLADLVREPVLRERDAGAPERIGLDQIGAGRQVPLVHLADDVGAGEHQVLVAPLVGFAAEVRRTEVATLQIGPRRAVENEDALGEQRAETFGAGGHPRHHNGGRPRCKVAGAAPAARRGLRPSTCV